MKDSFCFLKLLSILGFDTRNKKMKTEFKIQILYIGMARFSCMLWGILLYLKAKCSVGI